MYRCKYRMSEISDSEVEALFTELEAEFKTVVSNLDAAIKGLKALQKKAKKGVLEEVVVVSGKKLVEVLDLAVGEAKRSKKSYGKVVLEQLQ